MNQTIFQTLYNLASTNNFFGQAALFFGHYLPFFLIPLIIIYAIWELSRDRSSYSHWVLVVLISGGTWAISESIKYWYLAPRPFIVDSTIRPLLEVAGNSFPSSHAAFFFALAFSLIHFHPRLASWYFLAAIFISASRVALGVHFPVDILGGFVLACLVNLIIKFALRMYHPTLERRHQI